MIRKYSRGVIQGRSPEMPFLGESAWERYDEALEAAAA
jgi:hypothetical protein